MKTDRRFQIKKSTIPKSGNGLFLKKPLAKDDTIQVRGVLVKRNSDLDHCTHFADAYKFRVGSHVLIPLGWEAMINHSEDPNLVKVIQGKKVFLRALRAIHPSEELFFRYSRFAQNRFYKNRRPG